MDEIIRIPDERVKVLIGKEAAVKKLIEKKCNVKLKINDSEVHISGEPMDIFFSREIVHAIGRGFEPRKALLLLKDDFALYIIPLRKMLNSEKAITRIKGRVIGEKGRMRTLIEHATDCHLSVYGNTIAIIAKTDSMEYAKEAVSMIIAGSKHTTVQSYLAKAKRKILEERFRS